MLFATSFGDAVSSPDLMQMLLGAIIPFAMVWLSGRFPMLATILKALGVNLNPAPPSPSPDPAPVPLPPPDKLTIADLVKLLLELISKRKQASAADDQALKVVAEALAVK